jgi:hypothetical protein
MDEDTILISLFQFCCYSSKSEIKNRPALGGTVYAY